jgi:hypothetical protein
MVVGWYHSHPGFGCWLSGVDINTQQSFEALNARAVAVVVDPVQSVKVRGGCGGVGTERVTEGEGKRLFGCKFAIPSSLIPPPPRYPHPPPPNRARSSSTRSASSAPRR